MAGGCSASICQGQQVLVASILNILATTHGRRTILAWCCRDVFLHILLPELVGEFSGNIHEGSLQAASTVHKRGCCDWPLSINIDQSLHSEPTTFLLLLHSCKTNAMTRLLRKESRKRKQFIHKEPRSFHTFHKFSHVLTTGRLSTRKT